MIYVCVLNCYSFGVLLVTPLPAFATDGDDKFDDSCMYNELLNAESTFTLQALCQLSLPSLFDMLDDRSQHFIWKKFSLHFSRSSSSSVYSAETEEPRSAIILPWFLWSVPPSPASRTPPPVHVASEISS